MVGSLYADFGGCGILPDVPQWTCPLGRFSKGTRLSSRRLWSQSCTERGGWKPSPEMAPCDMIAHQDVVKAPRAGDDTLEAFANERWLVSLRPASFTRFTCNVGL